MEKEKYEVNEEIKKKAGECAHGFRCLTDPKSIVCNAEYLLADQNLFVKEKNGRNCDRYLSYGIAGICRCPVRVELYRRYRV
jgi:hypothetical protein